MPHTSYPASNSDLNWPEDPEFHKRRPLVASGTGDFVPFPRRKSVMGRMMLI
jgi:hypothetical protein